MAMSKGEYKIIDHYWFTIVIATYFDVKAISLSSLIRIDKDFTNFHLRLFSRIIERLILYSAKEILLPVS